MLSLLLASLIAFASAQVIVVPNNPVNLNGPNVATRVQLLPGGGFRLFDADDLSDCRMITRTFPRGSSTHLRPVMASDEDLEDRKINWREITKIAGQINQIGKVLGFDADEIEDIPIIPACAVIGAGCALIDTGLNIYDHIKGEDEAEVLGYDAEDLTDKKINLDEIEKIARQIEQIIEILKSEDSDFENGFGKKLRKLCRRISRNIRRELPKITNIAGKVAQVGGALGFDEEDLDDYTNPIPGMIVHYHNTHKPQCHPHYW